VRRRLLLALLPLVWSWDPGTLDCHGNPADPGVAYVVTQVMTETAGWRQDCTTDPDTGEEVCIWNIVYWPAVLVGEDELVDPRYPDDAVYVPPLRGVTFIDVEAVDDAGNVSGGACE